PVNHAAALLVRRTPDRRRRDGHLPPFAERSDEARARGAGHHFHRDEHEVAARPVAHSAHLPLGAGSWGPSGFFAGGGGVGPGGRGVSPMAGSIPESPGGGAAGAGGFVPLSGGLSGPI